MAASQNEDKRPENEDENMPKNSGEHQKHREEKHNSNIGDGRQKQKEYFKEELNRLRKSLQRDAEKIKPPPKKKYTPDTFNALTPYFNVYTVEYLMDMPLEFRQGSSSRNTAVGLTEPWIDHKMDVELLPKIAPRTLSMEEKKPKRARPNRGVKEGSTHLPKFPSVCIAVEESKRILYYSDVPLLREALDKKYRSSSSDKFEEDYRRTKQDFHRMDLSMLDHYHPLSRPHMRAAYFAYLQNNGGSRRAVYECVRATEKRLEEEKAARNTARRTPRPVAT